MVGKTLLSKYLNELQKKGNFISGNFNSLSDGHCKCRYARVKANVWCIQNTISGMVHPFVKSTWKLKFTYQWSLRYSSLWTTSFLRVLIGPGSFSGRKMSTLLWKPALLLFLWPTLGRKACCMHACIVWLTHDTYAKMMQDAESSLSSKPRFRLSPMLPWLFYTSELAHACSFTMFFT